MKSSFIRVGDNIIQPDYITDINIIPPYNVRIRYHGSDKYNDYYMNKAQLTWFLDALDAEVGLETYETEDI